MEVVQIEHFSFEEKEKYSQIYYNLQFVHILFILCSNGVGII